MTPTATCDDDLAALEAAYRQAAEAALEAITALTAPLEALAGADVRLRIARHRHGLSGRPRPEARALAAEALTAAAAPVRPYVPFVTDAAGRRAGEQLLTLADDDA